MLLPAKAMKAGWLCVVVTPGVFLFVLQKDSKVAA